MHLVLSKQNSFTQSKGRMPKTINGIHTMLTVSFQSFPFQKYSYGVDGWFLSLFFGLLFYPVKFILPYIFLSITIRVSWTIRLGLEIRCLSLFKILVNMSTNGISTTLILGSFLDMLCEWCTQYEIQLKSLQFLLLIQFGQGFLVKDML